MEHIWQESHNQKYLPISRGQQRRVVDDRYRGCHNDLVCVHLWCACSSSLYSLGTVTLILRCKCEGVKHQTSQAKGMVEYVYVTHRHIRPNHGSTILIGGSSESLSNLIIIQQDIH